MSRTDEIKRWFKKHKASHYQLDFLNGKKCEKLIWSDGTSTYHVEYITNGKFLFICGDIGEAVFEWSQNINLEWVADCDLSYFAGKCKASEFGTKYESWNKEKSLKILKDYFKEELECKFENEPKKFLTNEQLKKLEQYDDYENFVKNNPNIISNYLDKRLNELTNLACCEEDPWNTEFGWNKFLWEHGYDFFGEDYGEKGRIGFETNMRCEAYLVGLKMAFEQIQEEKNA